MTFIISCRCQARVQIIYVLCSFSEFTLHKPWLATNGGVALLYRKEDKLRKEWNTQREMAIKETWKHIKSSHSILMWGQWRSMHLSPGHYITIDRLGVFFNKTVNIRWNEQNNHGTPEHHQGSHVRPATKKNVGNWRCCKMIITVEYVRPYKKMTNKKTIIGKDI